jgi:hypothetical protein
VNRRERPARSQTAILTGIDDRRHLLAAYDEQLRTDAETSAAIAVTRLGPLHLATFAAGQGFVTYRDLGGADARAIGQMVAGALASFQVDPDINQVEWKTRAHDHAPGLPAALRQHGFVAEEPESIMIGEAHRLAVEVALPDSVTLRQVTEEPDVRAMCAMANAVFAQGVSEEMGDALLRRLSLQDGMELWVAEAAGRMVSAGRLEPVRGTGFAGIWGGATCEDWRGRGIYRALTAARARSAMRIGKTLINCDSTEYSRPILERSGLVRVSLTTPYRWRRRSRVPARGLGHRCSAEHPLA